MHEPVGVRTEYLLDAARSHTIHDALRPVLSEIRHLLGASVGLVAYRPRRHEGHLLVLAADTPDLPEPPLPNEAFHANLSTPRRAAVLSDIRFASAVRSYRLRLASAMVVPWRDPFGDGMVVVGHTEVRPGLPAPAADLVRRLRQDVRRSMSSGRRSGAGEINRGLQRVMKDIAVAAVDCADVGEALTTLILSAKWLFDSEVAYLSLPTTDADTFTFDQMLGIRTSDFRHLRIREGQGLGGLARSLRRPVRSVDYGRDPRLFAAPVAETAQEGIVSAMATPIVVDDQVQAVLYVGDRSLRPFSETDEELLGEVAEYATLGLKRQATEAYRRDVLRRQEQERLAYDLHDTAVRGLLEIGFAAERARAADHGAPDVRADLDSIAAAAERCMEALRGQLDLLVQGTSGRSASAVLEEIAEASVRPGAGHRFAVRGPDGLVPDPVAESLVRIGQEALVNVDVHAGGRAEVTLEVTSDEWVLSVVDDGSGAGAASNPPDDTRAHLGMMAMQRAAGRVLGRLEQFADSGGGHVVRVAVPTSGSR
ncbi:GAF domain-containing protein [Pseudonocardia sp. RS11V-5]|uniref:GAF domain-containing sensor histidine kinase n=1 Tax=Pseudonocardia terrae TaxID=2905831 RepID=UPI001E39D283|nr:GAF domain-containing protein [Pseudonocardia terrae]MCE3552756.1 GAF domain-containing protein [Pseudonocardia terrae]